MSDLVLVALVGAAQALILGGLGAIAAAHRHLSKRLHRYEERERLWWIWTRRLIDQIYRGDRLPAEPPAGLFYEADDPERTTA